MMTLQATRRQLMTQRTKTMVCFKGLCQQWGVRLKAKSSNLKKMRLAVEAKEELLSAPVVTALVQMLEHIRSIDHQINALNKALKTLLLQDERGVCLMKSMEWVYKLRFDLSRLLVTSVDSPPLDP